MHEASAPTSPLHGIEIPTCSMGLSEKDGVLTFHVAFHAGSEHGPRIHVVATDGEGVLHAYTRETGDADPADFAGSGTGSHDSDEALRTLMGFGIASESRSYLDVPNGDIAIEMAVEAERAHPALKAGIRAETVGAAQRAMLDAGLSRILARIGPERLEVQRRCDAHPMMDMRPRLRSNATEARNLVRTMGLYGAMADDMAVRSRHLDLSAAPEDLAGQALATAGLVDARSRTVLRQVAAGVGPERLTPGFARLLSQIPPDWIPRAGDRAEWDALGHLAATLAKAVSETRQGMPILVAPARGRWADFAARLANASATDLTVEPTLFDLDGFRGLHAAVGDLGDMRADLIDSLVRPLVSHVRGEAVPVNGEVDGLSCTVLYAGRGLPRILEMSRRWHRMGGVALRSPGGGASTMSWLPILPGRRDGDVRIVRLASARALADEGSRGTDEAGLGGLHHCVASRWKPCMRGESRVMGVRAAADGARLSTFEVSLVSGKPVLVEHRGHGNAVPPPEAVRAVGAYMADLGGTLPYDARELVSSRGRKLTLEDVCGYDWRDGDAIRTAIAAWSAYLPRPLRTMGPAAFLAAIRAGAHRVPDTA